MYPWDGEFYNIIRKMLQKDERNRIARSTR